MPGPLPVYVIKFSPPWNPITILIRSGSLHPPLLSLWKACSVAFQMISPFHFKNGRVLIISAGNSLCKCRVCGVQNSTSLRFCFEVIVNKAETSCLLVSMLCLTSKLHGVQVGSVHCISTTDTSLPAR